MLQCEETIPSLSGRKVKWAHLKKRVQFEKYRFEKMRPVTRGGEMSRRRFLFEFLQVNIAACSIALLAQARAPFRHASPRRAEFAG